MTERDREFATRNAAREPGPQPDPMLGEGRASSGRKWAITAAIVILLLAVMYGITARRTDSSDQQRQNNAQNAPASSTTVPGQALPGGRTTADAPPTAKPSTVTPAPSK